MVSKLIRLNMFVTVSGYMFVVLQVTLKCDRAALKKNWLCLVHRYGKWNHNYSSY